MSVSQFICADRNGTAPKLVPFNLMRWIDERRNLLQPPIGNTQIWRDSDFIAMVIGGPNDRIDYHDDPFEEIFFQLKGDMILRVMQDGHPVDITIREGDTLLLPPHVRHSPQRPPGTIGLVIERNRPEGMFDGFDWYCERCHSLVDRRELQLQSIVDDLEVLYEGYAGDPARRTCKSCGHVNASSRLPRLMAAE